MKSVVVMDELSEDIEWVNEYNHYMHIKAKSSHLWIVSEVKDSNTIAYDRTNTTF